MTPPDPAGIPCWDRLSTSAKRTLLDLAELFDGKVDGELRMLLSQGGAKDVRVTTTPAVLRELSKRAS
jgi:hypothetical protein